MWQGILSLENRLINWRCTTQEAEEEHKFKAILGKKKERKEKRQKTEDRGKKEFDSPY